MVGEGGWRPTLEEYVVPLQGAIVVCYGWAGRVTTNLAGKKMWLEKTALSSCRRYTVLYIDNTKIGILLSGVYGGIIFFWSRLLLEWVNAGHIKVGWCKAKRLWREHMAHVQPGPLWWCCLVCPSWHSIPYQCWICNHHFNEKLWREACQLSSPFRQCIKMRKMRKTRRIASSNRCRGQKMA